MADDGAGGDGDGAVRWTDNHCHLGWTGWGDEEGEGDEGPGVDEAFLAALDEAVVDARTAGVERLVTVGTDAARSRQAVAAAARHPGVVWATVGLHPHDARHGLDGVVAVFDDPASAGRCVAVGECGLDYHYDHSPREVQRQAFAAQVALAHERDLALVIHTRAAWDDTFAILDAEGVPERTIMHCFTGGPDEARRSLDRGAHLSFSGIVTFPKAQELRDAAALCPLDRVLVETDSPYLTPVPHRGRPNRPALVPLVGAAVAGATGRPVAEVAAATWANASRVYRLPSH
jgi:TatD DNase family protein